MSDQQQVSMLNHLINSTPKKVEVNEATVDEVVGFGRFMKKSDAEVTEAIDLYKALGDDISCNDIVVNTICK